MAIRALEAANYLVFLLNDSCDDLTNMKLNKLLYYAQGHCLQETGDVLFGSVIQAWEHGPVIPDVYDRYKRYDKAPIPEADQEAAKRVSEGVRNLLMYVAREYGRYTAGALRNMTHVRKGPWDRVYVEGQKNIEIPVTLIKEYFDANMKHLAPVEIALTPDDFVGHRDEDGILVLPEGWDDEAV